MKKPNPKAYGSENELWEKGGKEAYELAVKRWEEYRQKYGIKNPGRQRTRLIHPSWNGCLEQFQPVPGRSQGAFCDWANLNRSTFSAMQTKPIPIHIVELIGAWMAKGKEVEGE